MSAEIHINGDVRTVDEADASWIAKSINGRKHDGVAVQVRVVVKEPGIDIVLAAPPARGRGGGRMPNNREREVLEMWNRHHLGDVETKVGELVAFIKELVRYL
jgi:hypothetical protein